MGGSFIRTIDRRPSRSADRFPCFDGLRAIAALTVIGVHTTFASGFTGRSGVGNYTSRLEIGVSVFFVISGFLLYRPFATAHFGWTAPPGTSAFWGRRLRRIIPAYWVAFVVVSYLLHADTVHPGLGSLAIYLGFAQIYSAHYALSGITQAWSLCTEMSFYLLLPVWAICVGRKRRSGEAQLRRELAGLAALTALSFGFRIWVLQWHSALAPTMPNWLPAYTDLFALGMLLAVLSAYLSVTDRRPAWLWHPALPVASWAVAVAAFVAVSNIGLPLTPITPSPVGPSLLRQTLSGVFAFGLVVPAVFGAQEHGFIRAMLRSRALVLVGVVSYGVYLWHEAAMNLFLRWTHDRLFTIPLWELSGAVTAMAVLAAAVSYLLLERPFLRGSSGVFSRSAHTLASLLPPARERAVVRKSSVLHPTAGTPPTSALSATPATTP
jgi:peptidoglycan/LPS O-acetylase OafA/YrhL